MKDIVVMFVHTHLNLPEEQRPDVAKAQCAETLVTDDGSLPQFWTWFIENPRPGSCRSFTNTARLTLPTLKGPTRESNASLEPKENS